MHVEKPGRNVYITLNKQEAALLKVLLMNIGGGGYKHPYEKGYISPEVTPLMIADIRDGIMNKLANELPDNKPEWGQK